MNTAIENPIVRRCVEIDQRAKAMNNIDPETVAYFNRKNSPEVEALQAAYKLVLENADEDSRGRLADELRFSNEAYLDKLGLTGDWICSDCYLPCDSESIDNPDGVGFERVLRVSVCCEAKRY